MEYLGEAFSRMVARTFLVAALLVVLAIVAAFFIGRCSAGYSIEFKSPVIVESKK